MALALPNHQSTQLVVSTPLNDSQLVALLAAKMSGTLEQKVEQALELLARSFVAVAEHGIQRKVGELRAAREEAAEITC